MVQRKYSKENGFFLVIVKEAKYLKKINEKWESEEINIILKFTQTAISKFNKNSRVGNHEFQEVIEKLDVDELFPEKMAFEDLQCAFETGAQWQKWGDFFIKDLFEEEINHSVSFKEEAKHLIQRDAQINSYSIVEPQ